MENTIKLPIVAFKAKTFTDHTGAIKDYFSCIVDTGEDMATIGTAKAVKVGDFLAIGVVVKDGKLLPKVLEVVSV